MDPYFHMIHGIKKHMYSFGSRLPWGSSGHCRQSIHQRARGHTIGTVSAGVARSACRMQRNWDCVIFAGSTVPALDSSHSLQCGRQYFSYGRCRPYAVPGATAAAVVLWGIIYHRRHAAHHSRAATSPNFTRQTTNCRSSSERQAKSPIQLNGRVSSHSAESDRHGFFPNSISTAPVAPPPSDASLEPSLNYKAVVAYDGTDFAGFQLQAGQPGSVTIQGRLEKALATVAPQPRQALKLQCSGRTDSGVHAAGQVVSFFLPGKCCMTEGQVMRGLNARCPPSLRVLLVARVPRDFSARHTAIGKLYRYSVTTAEVADPFYRLTNEHVPWPLDMDAIRQVAALFRGTHDFRQFANLSPSNEWRNPVKTLTRFDVVDTPTGFDFEIEGNGFLYKMVRHMVGAALTVGRSRMSIAQVEAALLKGSKELPGAKYRGWNIASSRGLCLMRVDYPPHHDLDRLMHPERVPVVHLKGSDP